MAPTLEFILSEITLAGSPIVPNNFWQMDFLVDEEGGFGGNSAGPQDCKLIIEGLLGFGGRLGPTGTSRRRLLNQSTRL